MPDRLLCVYIMLSIFHRIPINYLLVNLAVADILYVTFISPNVFIIQFSFTNLPDGVTGTVLCKFFITGTLAWVGAASSILTLAVVAVERYYAVVYPLGDKEKITMDNLKVSLTDIFLLLVRLYSVYLTYKKNVLVNSYRMIRHEPVSILN